MIDKNINIETRIANRLKSIFAAGGQTVNDFYLEIGIYCIGLFNAGLVSWDIYTSLISDNQPLAYAIVIALIALVAVEGLAVYLVGAAAKTNNGLLWFFSVVFASFFTYAHYQEGSDPGAISRYIMLAIPFFVVIGYWARTIKVEVETDQVAVIKEQQAERERRQQIEDEERARKWRKDDEERDRKHLERMAQIEAQKEVSMTLKSGVSSDLARVTPTLDTLNDTKKVTADTRRQEVLEMVNNNLTYSEIADQLGVSLSTIKRDVKALNGSVVK